MNSSMLEVGSQLWEKCIDGEMYTAGRVVSIIDDPSRSDRIFLMLRNEKDEYTIYVTQKNCECHPHVVRFIPGEALQDLMSGVFDSESVPDDEAPPASKVKKVSKKSAAKSNPVSKNEKCFEIELDQDLGDNPPPQEEVIQDQEEVIQDQEDDSELPLPEMDSYMDMIKYD